MLLFYLLLMLMIHVLFTNLCFLVSIPGSCLITFPEGGHVGEVSVQVVVIIRPWETAGALLVFWFLCSAPLSEDRNSQSGAWGAGDNGEGSVMHRGPEAFLEVCRNTIKIRLVILVVHFLLADFSCILLGFCSARTEKKCKTHTKRSLIPVVTRKIGCVAGRGIAVHRDLIIHENVQELAEKAV